MSFRTVVIKERSKLDLKLNYLVCRNATETKVFIPEISVLILESTAISMTTALISELVKNNVKIVFCDERHNPESEVCAYYGNFNSVKKISTQVSWSKEAKAVVWAEIIRNKIKKQKELLIEEGHEREAEMLEVYQHSVSVNDSTNREGHSAKVYFNALFGLDFTRRNNSLINGALNYGYSIILSCFNREIARCGYLTQLGIWHRNEFNQFNLASDLMEPFRILVDRFALTLDDEASFKMKMLELFNQQVTIDGKVQYLENAISIYCQSVFNALETGDKSLIKFYE